MRKPLALQWEEGDILFSLFKQKIKKESKEEIRKHIASCISKDVVKPLENMYLKGERKK